MRINIDLALSLKLAKYLREKLVFASHQTCILTRRRQKTYKGTAHNMNRDAHFSNGLDKENVMHFDKK